MPVNSTGALQTISKLGAIPDQKIKKQVSKEEDRL